MQALILAAGMGKRLKKLTQDNTKCMVEVNGVTLIERMLKQLDELNLKQIVMVVGYQGNKLIEFIETLSIKTPVIYVENKVYEKTNNIYSLSLVKDFLCADDTILLESDLIFEDGILTELLADKRDTLALVDKYESWMDGTVVKIDEHDVIHEFVPGSSFVYEDIPYYYKTVNIYKFSKKFSQTQYVPFLSAYMSALGKNEYYEQVLRVITLLDNPMIKAKKLEGQLWYEIDDVQDLDIASSMFVEGRTQKCEKIKQRYGGYWRYPKLLNFSYPVNPFFPPGKLLDEIKANVGKLISEYPSGMQINSLLVAKNLGGLCTEWVVVSNGLEEIIKTILSLCAGKVGMIKPTNEEFRNRIKERDIVFFTSENSNLAYTGNDLQIWFADKNIKVLVLSNPDYHSGNYIVKNDLLKLLEWAKRQDIKIILDESYCDFADEENNSLLNEQLLLKYKNLIVLKNLSVTHGISGLRLGCAVSADTHFVKRMQEDVAIWNINSFAEFYLQIEEKYQKQYFKSIARFKEVRKELIYELGKVPYLRVIPTQANYVLCEVLGDFTATKLTEDLLNDYNILIKDMSERVDNNGQYVKFAIRKPEENGKLLKALQNISDMCCGRIFGDNISIDEAATMSFFDDRVNKKLPHRYNYVIYQDSNPKLALERDLYEKEKIRGILEFKKDDYVLDIGCGVGRWGDELVTILEQGKYVGVDYSESLLEMAREHLQDTGKCEFYKGSFQKIQNILEMNNANILYDKVLINGVLMYINDVDIEKCLNSVDALLKKGGVIYIKESVGLEKRFTLKDFYSKELTSTYNAIYRSVFECDKLLNKCFIQKGYTVIDSGETWKQLHQNRTETTSYYWVIKK